jgi:hypothetical protein
MQSNYIIQQKRQKRIATDEALSLLHFIVSSGLLVIASERPKPQTVRAQTEQIEGRESKERKF